MIPVPFIPTDGQAVKKDPRTFNEEFIQTTFRRLKETNLLPKEEPSPKLTSRQFGSLFVALVERCFPGYKPPESNNWMEQEVPGVMETLGYPTKVMKSTLQTVSSKVGPIMGILDFLMDFAEGMKVDHEQAIRLLSKESQFDLDTELLAQSTFARGVTVDAPHIQEIIKDFCAKSKGVDDENAIR